MGRKGDHKPPQQVGNPNDPQGMAVLLERFLEWLRVKNYSERTVTNRQVYHPAKDERTEKPIDDEPSSIEPKANEEKPGKPPTAEGETEPAA